MSLIYLKKLNYSIKSVISMSHNLVSVLIQLQVLKTLLQIYPIIQTDVINVKIGELTPYIMTRRPQIQVK